MKQDTQRLGDVARVCRDCVTAMRVVAVVAVAVAVAVAAAEVAEIEIAGAVERGHSTDD